MKVILFIVLLIMPIFINAECDYSTKREYNDLASYVNYSYEFDENKKTFSVTIYNINQKLKVLYKSEKLTVLNNKAYIYDVPQGETIEIVVRSNTVECVSEKLRIIKINIPYVNPYYDSQICRDFMELNVCYSKFLSYQITQDMFYDEIEKRQQELNTEPISSDQTILKEEDENVILVFLKQNYIKIIIAVISGVITYLIGKSLVRKAEHGI